MEKFDTNPWLSFWIHQLQANLSTRRYKQQKASISSNNHKQSLPISFRLKSALISTRSTLKTLKPPKIQRTPPNHTDMNYFSKIFPKTPQISAKNAQIHIKIQKEKKNLLSHQFLQMSTKSLARKGEKASDSPTDRSVTSDPPPRTKISCRSRIWNLPLPLSPPAIKAPQEESDISPFPEHGPKKAKDSKQFASLFYSFSPSYSLLPDPRPISVK